MSNSNALAKKPPKKFSVAITTDTYQRLIKNTLGDPERSKRFIASISSAVAVNPQLQECEAGSILSGALLGESLNLSPSPQLGQYYLVPFSEKVKKDGRIVYKVDAEGRELKDQYGRKIPETITKAQFIPGYKGYMQLAMRSGQLKKINAVEIKEGELKHYDPLRFGCGNWLVKPLIELGVNPKNIDVLNDGTSYNYGVCNIIPVPLVHNVPNCGYKIHFPFGKMIYATDTNNLNGIIARHYDLYLIEANYDDKEIKERIKAKEVLGLYCYEKQVLRNHLSTAKCNDFILKNCAPYSKYVYMHRHDYSKDTEVTDYVNDDSASA
ncbi:MAG: recombinase RecT [Eubacterium sp.]|nr:recombinase RecT [Eubacterium sp.]